MCRAWRIWAIVVIALLGMVEGTTTGTRGDRAQSPVVIATVPLAGTLAGDMVVDVRTHRAFVASTDREGIEGYIGVVDSVTAASLGSVTAAPFINAMEVDEGRGHVFGISGPPESPGAVIMLAVRDGAVLHRTTIGMNPGSVALDAAHGRLYIVMLNNDGTGAVDVLDTRSDALLYTVALGIQLGTQLNLSPVALDEARRRLFVATAQGVSVLDTQRGVLVRTVALGTEPIDLALDARTGRLFVLHGPPGGPLGRVSVLDARSGALLHTITVVRDASEMTVDVGTGHVFAAGVDGVDMLDARSGAMLRVIQTRINPLDLVVVARTGRVFVNGSVERTNGGSANVADVLDASTGGVLHTVALGAGTPRIKAIDERTGRVFVVAGGPSKGNVVIGPGHVDVLDGYSGAVRQTVIVGREPSAVALDPQTGLSFVVDNADSTVTVLAATAGTGPARRVSRPALPAPAPLPRTLPIVGAAVAVDECTNRVFIVGYTTIGRRTVGMVDMLDGRSAVLLHREIIKAPLDRVVVDATTGRVFAGGDHSVSVLDAQNGRLLRTVRVPEHLVYSKVFAVATQAGRVVVGSEPTDPSQEFGFMSVLDARQGTVLRTIQLPLVPVSVGVDENLGRVFVAAAGRTAAALSILDARSGSIVRTVHLGNQPLAIAVDQRTARVFVSTDPTVTVLDARTGAVRRTAQLVDVGGAREIAVAERSGRLFVNPGGSGTFTINVLDARTGTLIRTVTLDYIVATTPVVDGRTNRVFVLGQSPIDVRTGEALGPGVLGVLDATTGAVRHNLSLPGNVSSGNNAIAVDSRTDRVFVLTDNKVVVLDTTRL